jgi:ABC-type transport system involved in multi-copper enzyme maturation permease subunit
MLQFLFKLEWLKIRRNPTALLSFGMYAFTALCIMVLISSTSFSMAGGAVSSASFQKIPGIFEFGFYMLSWLTMFLVVYQAISLITNEYSQRTLRQNIITGMERSEWITGKFIMMTSLNLGLTVFGSSLLVIFGLINSGGAMQGIEQLPAWAARFFILNQGYMTLGLFIGLLTRRSGVAVAIVLPYIMFVEDALRYIIFKPSFPFHKLNAMLPVISFDNMVPNPAFKYKAVADIDTQVVWSMGFQTDLLLSVGWIALFTFLSYTIIQKRDL